ncbi:MAG: hypothetical protein WD669_03415 [Pirellulales bacterium]
MSQLLDIRKRIEVAGQRILTLERAFRDHPNLPSIATNLEAAVRVQEKLQQQFEEVAAKAGYDICRYRTFDDYDRPVVGAAFKSIADFQNLVSVVYAAMKYGLRERATIPDDVAKESTFDLGYLFTGSIGIVLTVRDQKMLFDNSLMDQSMETVFAMTRASTPQQVSEFADKLGPGPINALYKWVGDNATNGLGAEIDWRKGQEVQRSVVVQRQELVHLKRTIESTSSKRTKTITVVGMLTMADVSKNRFKIRPEGLPEIRGTVAVEAIDDKHIVKLPSVYSADFRNDAC